jgi:hypothetical protein
MLLESESFYLCERAPGLPPNKNDFNPIKSCKEWAKAPKQQGEHNTEVSQLLVSDARSQGT